MAVDTGDASCHDTLQLHDSAFADAKAEKLVNAVRNASRIEALEQVTDELGGCHMNTRMITALLKAGASTIFADALKKWDDLPKFECMMLICIMAGVSGDFAMAFAEEGVLEVLIPYAGEKAKGRYSPATYALLQMTKTDVRVTQRLRDVPDIIENLEELNDKTGYAKEVVGRLRLLSPSGRLTKSARMNKQENASASATSASSDTPEIEK